MDQSTIEQKQNPMANYQFSTEEIRVLRECNTESFFQRSLPLGTGFGLAAYFGVKNGYLRPNIKYGSVPKVVVGVIVGYFVGKFSYQQKCAEKIMQLPNSKLGELLRQRKQNSGIGSLATEQNLGVGLALSPFVANTTDIYSDEMLYDGDKESALNLDTESRPLISGLDELYRPSLDNPQPFMEQELPIEPKTPGTTYEDLRRRNREDYARNQQNQSNRSLSSEASGIPRRTDASKSIPPGDTKNIAGHNNKYGDTWIE